MYNGNQNHRVAPEIRRLIHKSFDGPVTDDEIRQIQSALAKDADIRQWYGEIAQLHADLASTEQSLAICRETQLEFQSSNDAPEIATGRQLRRALSERAASVARRFPFGVAASLLAVGLALGCGVGLFAATMVHVAPKFLASPWNWKVENDVVAKIVSTHKVKWQSSESPETLPSQGLRQGQQIRIAEGLLQVQYRNGVSIILNGPAVFEIRSEHGGKLYSGRMSAVSPAEAASFNIETTAGVFQMGPGHYGIEVLELDDGSSVVDQQTAVHVIAGMASGLETAQFLAASGDRTSLQAGDSAQFQYGLPPQFAVELSGDHFPAEIPKSPVQQFTGDTILLGNLFDDGKSSSLTEAMETDDFQAAGETIDLGVATVLDGGLDVDVRLAEDGVLFNFYNVGGGGPRVRGLPGNDTYRSVEPVPIRTTGENFGGLGPMHKIEEGIGLCANELVTFDLQEIRLAGQLSGRTMRFLADRAGINDREDPLESSREMARANLIVLVSDADGLVSAYVNGEPCEIATVGGVSFIDLDKGRPPRPLTYNGRFVSFDVPVAPDARFLTLAATMAGVEHHDHVVFSGARLEIQKSEQFVANNVD